MKKTSLVSTSSLPRRNVKCSPWKPVVALIGSLISLVSLDSLRAGTFSNSFNADPSAQIFINLPALWVASGSYDGSGYISLTDAIASQNNGSVVLPDLDTNAIGGFLATFKLRMGGGTARPADGFSMSFGPEVADSSQTGEEGLGSGIIICFDTWDNNAPDTAPAIDVKVGGSAEGNIIATAFMDGQREGNRAPPGPLFTDPNGNTVSLGTGTNFVDVRIELRDGLFNLSFKGIEIFKNLPVTFAPIAGRFLFGARTGGANDNHWIDDLQITTFPPSAAPTVTRFAGSAAGFEITITNGSTQVQSSSVRTSLDGTNVVSPATSAGGITSVKYTAPSLLPAGSAHSVTLTYSDSANVSRTNTFTFTVAQYTVVSPGFATPTGAVSTNAPGFNARVHQISVTRTPGDANSPANAERQLADGYIDPATGQPYPNGADLTDAVNGIFAITNYINWNNGPPVSAGNFSDITTPAIVDDPVPGIPAAGDNIVAEILTFLDLKAGLYRMGVNSDDGFKVTTGTDPRDVLSAVLLGQFPTGRGALDTLFDFVIQADGIYPFRLLWWEGGGDASVEWFAVNQSTGQRILINDRTDPTGIRAYRQGATLPYVKSAHPLPNATGVALNTNITIAIADGSTRLIQTNSIQLFFNGQAVTPAITKPAGTNITTVVYDPPGDLQPENRYSVRLIYGDNSTPQILVTNDFSFVSSPTFVTLFAIDDRTMWRYDRSGLDLGTAWKEKTYNDSAWPEGAALIGEEPGATAEPLRTPIMRFNDSGEYVETFYYRTHFTLTNNPSSVRLQLRHVVDDGALFYLNGVEVHRFGYAAGVPVLFDNSGAGGHENAYEGPFSISTASLVTGDNVFAVEVHQSGTGSSDTVFGAELLAITSRAPDPSIESTVPAANALDVALNTNIEITILDGVQQVQPNSIQLFLNGQAVTPMVDKPPGSLRTKVTYDPPGDLPQNTSNSVRLIYGDNSTPPVLRTNEFSFTTTGPSVLIFAINDTQLWSYENTGQTNLGTAWKEKNYNDSAWTNGPALLALESDPTPEPIRTQLSRIDPNGVQIITDYFRTHFNFAGAPATSQLRIRHIVDDGFVLYLNGNEIYRFGLAAGTPVTSTTLFGGHENQYEGPFVVPATGLVQGDNVLAAEVHQSATTSSDIVFGLEVSAVIPGGTPQTPRITGATLSAGNINIQWSGGGTLESGPSITGPWTTTNDSDGSFSEAATGAAKYYRVRR